MTAEHGRFATAIDAFDAANAEDPNSVLIEGVRQPKELVYGRRMSAWLLRFKPDASEALRLAVRCQHIRRWSTPRSSYPEGRIGYLTWRRDLQRFHAEVAGSVLTQAGYESAVIERVQSLLKKENLKRDQDAQALEDVACLVFLDHYLAEFAASHDDAKVVDIIAKTWRKMSDAGHRAALAISLPEALKKLVEQGVASAQRRAS